LNLLLHNGLTFSLIISVDDDERSLAIAFRLGFLVVLVLHLVLHLERS